MESTVYRVLDPHLAMRPPLPLVHPVNAVQERTDAANAVRHIRVSGDALRGAADSFESHARRVRATHADFLD